jgi:hypothetical protein
MMVDHCWRWTCLDPIRALSPTHFCVCIFNIIHVCRFAPFFYVQCHYKKITYVLTIGFYPLIVLLFVHTGIT